MRRHWDRCTLVVLLLGGAACGDEAVGPSLGPPAVRLEGRVVDAEGTPVREAVVSFLAWPTTSTEADTLPVEARTTADGEYGVWIGRFEAVALDSVLVEAWQDPCTGLAATSTIRRAIPLAAGPADTVTVDVVMDRVAPLATLQEGAACALGWAPFGDDVAAFYVQLAIDAIDGDQVTGRWRMNYAFTRGDDMGYFTGTTADATLVLELAEARPESPCDYRLTIPVEDGGRLGPATYLSHDVACAAYAGALTFAVGEHLTLPSPVPATRGGAH
jgi:hypothetical protein